MAADLGFTDHAHLTTTVRHHLGQPPSALRAALRCLDVPYSYSGNGQDLQVWDWGGGENQLWY